MDSKENLIKWLFTKLVEVNRQLAQEFCNYTSEQSKEEILEDAAKKMRPEQFKLLKETVQ